LVFGSFSIPFLKEVFSKLSYFAELVTL